MNDRSPHLNYLIKLQSWAWYLFFACFLVAGGLSFLGTEIAERVTFWTIIVLLLVTIAKLVIIGEQFRRSGLSHMCGLSYFLVLVLLSTILLKYLLL